MGEALARGLLASAWPAGEIAVVEPDAERRSALADLLPGVALLDAPGPTEAAVVAVKPVHVEAACRALASTGATRVLSIAAGVRLSALEAWLAPGVAVMRAMPNTPALVNSGAAALAPGRGAQDVDLSWAEEVLAAVGMVVRVSEDHLDAVTGLSGSGPAYIFLVVEALIDAGVAAGLTRDVSRALVVATVAGSARLLVASGDEPAKLRADVTSPGGTTAAGIRCLEAAAVRSAFTEAVLAAADRSRDLGRSPTG